MAGLNSQWGPFEEGPVSVEDRITCKGRERQDCVWQIYVREEGATADLHDKYGDLSQNKSELGYVGKPFQSRGCGDGGVQILQ